MSNGVQVSRAGDNLSTVRGHGMSVTAARHGSCRNMSIKLTAMLRKRDRNLANIHSGILSEQARAFRILQKPWRIEYLSACLSGSSSAEGREDRPIQDPCIASGCATGVSTRELGETDVNWNGTGRTRAIGQDIGRAA